MSSTPGGEYWRTFVTHLECSATEAHVAAGEIHGLSPAGKPLLVRYDLERIRATVDRDELRSRPADMWRYRELLPIQNERSVVSLGENATPLVPLTRMADELGLRDVLVKDEGRLPTGSFKARGMAVAVSMAVELGLTRLAMPTNGNAGAALAAYGSRAEMETFVFCPEDTPEVNVREIALQGAHVWRVNGLITDCGRIVASGTDAMGWFDMSTLKEPYRLEGKKTMGFELADQLGWEAPDVIFYPTGGGTGLIGMWKAFRELKSVGWLHGPLPRMVAVQASGCAPVVRAYEDGADHAEPWPDAHTVAAGIRVPAAIGDFLVLEAVAESGGFACAVADADIIAAQQRVAAEEGLLLCPEGAATVAAYVQSLEGGLVSPEERAVLFNCGSGLKYPMPPANETIDHRRPVNWAAMG